MEVNTNNNNEGIMFNKYGEIVFPGSVDGSHQVDVYKLRTIDSGTLLKLKALLLTHGISQKEYKDVHHGPQLDTLRRHNTGQSPYTSPEGQEDASL